jgi:hypothetical protein
MRLQTEAKIDEKWMLGQAPNAKYLLFSISGELKRHQAINMLVAYAADFETCFVRLHNRQVFTLSKGNAKAREMIGNLSAESIMIRRASNWIQRRLRVIRARGKQDVRDPA